MALPQCEGIQLIFALGCTGRTTCDKHLSRSQPGLHLPACSWASGESQSCPIPKYNNAAAPKRCCKGITYGRPSSSAGLSTMFLMSEVPLPRLSMGRGPGARQVPTCPGGRRRSRRCAAGSQRSRKSPRVSLPLVSAWEGPRGLMGPGQLPGSLGTKWWHKDSAPGTGRHVTCCARAARVPCPGAQWVRGTERLTLGFKTFCARVQTHLGQRSEWV